MSDLRSALMEVRDRIERFAARSSLLGESNTKANLIEPVLRALDWDVHDPEEVHREYRLRGADNPVDYGLLLDGAPRFLVEAKGLRENITDPRWANQLIGYAAVAGVSWVALTDGDTWRIYNGAAASVPTNKKLFRSVTISTDLDAAIATLQLLSRSAASTDQLDRLWRHGLVDRDVRTAVERLFEETNRPQLLDVLRPQLRGVDDAEALDALARLLPTFEQRSGTPMAKSSAPPAPSAPAAAVKRSAKGRRTPEETKITLREMIEAGVITAGEPLIARYAGVTFKAEVNARGKIVFEGSEYWPSGAGTAAKKSIRPDAPRSTLATDGWDFWSVPGANGQPARKLADIRHDLAKSR